MGIHSLPHLLSRQPAHAATPCVQLCSASLPVISATNVKEAYNNGLLT